MSQDEQHLQLLSIFHYVVGGIVGLIACLPCIHLALGIALVSGVIPAQPGHQGPPSWFGWIFICGGSVFILLGWSLAVATILAGRFLARRTHYIYCLVVAAIECAFMPFGSVLGVFTIVVLMRPSVKALFESGGRSSY